MSLPNPVDYHIYTGQPLPEPALYAYALADQGIVKLVETPHFSAAISVAVARWGVAGLTVYPEGLRLKVPKIPPTWLYSVLAHARKAASLSAGPVWRPVEQMYHFHWLNEGWRVSVPRQKARAGHVTYRGGGEASIVLDLHSHHEMGAFFSATDDADEQGCRFYGVIGRIYSRPELRLRLGVYGDWLEINPLEVFEDLGPFGVSYDAH